MRCAFQASSLGPLVAELSSRADEVIRLICLFSQARPCLCLSVPVVVLFCMGTCVVTCVCLCGRTGTQLSHQHKVPHTHTHNCVILCVPALVCAVAGWCSHCGAPA